jgi:Zn-dependent protease
MFKLKEFLIIVVVSVILAFTISLVESVNAFLYALLAVFVVIMLNVFAKKVTAFSLDSEVEVGLWEIKQFGFKPHRHFKKPFPAGVVFPVAVTLISVGALYWMANLVFEVRAKVYRAAKRYGLYRFSEMTEWHLGLIAASGIIINLLFAAVGYIVGYSDFARFSIYYAAFNLIPFSSLDGNKVFFGSIVLWSFLAALALLGLGYAFLGV